MVEFSITKSTTIIQKFTSTKRIWNQNFNFFTSLFSLCSTTAHHHLNSSLSPAATVILPHPPADLSSTAERRRPASTHHFPSFLVALPPPPSLSRPTFSLLCATPPLHHTSSLAFSAAAPLPPFAAASFRPPQALRRGSRTHIFHPLLLSLCVSVCCEGKSVFLILDNGR
ncbi:hypothetical protein BVRB_7g163600 isoform A [Beta vulgaris subsp. vulgaris]|nr:hypothetical protein BVRB_7g163600 isoform A [Beta vulgaris subsp. vulgaris]